MYSKPFLINKDIKIRAIFFLLCIISLSFHGRGHQKISGIPGAPMIKIKELSSLFSLKEGSKVSVNFFDAKFVSYTLSGVVKSHLNEGSNSGVLNIALTGSGGEYKLLITRKILYGNLVYKIKLIDKKTNTWYTNESSDKEYYLLSAKTQSQIVTE